MQRFNLEFETHGEVDIVNLSKLLTTKHADKIVGEGLIHFFAVGSTCGLTTIEYEPGLVQYDLKAMFQRIAPDDGFYHHEATWNDDNGHSHCRASLLGPSVTIPFSKGKLLTGQWQQVVFVDLDTRPRKRTVICTVM